MTGLYGFSDFPIGETISGVGRGWGSYNGYAYHLGSLIDRREKSWRRTTTVQIL